MLEGLGTALNSEPRRPTTATPTRPRAARPRRSRGTTPTTTPGRRRRRRRRSTRRCSATEPEQDLSRLIEGAGRTAAGLVRNETQLKTLITNFNITMAALASESANLRASIRELPGTLENANAAFASLNAAFPPTRAFAREILPGVRQTPATIDAAFPWIEQMRGLMSPAELQGLARDLSPVTRDLAEVHRPVDRAAAADQHRLEVRARRPAPDRRRRDPATSSRPGARTTRTSSTRWSGSRARARTSTATG